MRPLIRPRCSSNTKPAFESISTLLAWPRARDIDELVSLFAEDCELLPFRAQLEGIVYRGHEGLRRFAREGDEDWKAFRIDPVEFHDRGDRVAVVGRVRAL